MNNSNNYYVYVLLDSSKPGIYKYKGFELKFEPFYIGKGINNRIYETLYDKTPFKYNKIQKLKKANIKIISEKIYTNLSNEKALELEILTIKEIGRRDKEEGTLVNLTDGGDGRLNSQHSLSTKVKISETKKNQKLSNKHSIYTINKMKMSQLGEGNNFFGKSHNEKTKKKHSEFIRGHNHPMFNKTHSDETKQLLKEKRKNLSNEKIKEACKKFNKPVIKYDLDLNFICRYESVKTASIDTNINESIISKCCRGDIINPTRFFFKYELDKDKIKNNKYLIKVGSTFFFGKKELILIKRNKKTCVCESKEKNHVTIHIDDFPVLFRKDTNDSDITELLIFLRKLDSKFKYKDGIIKNDSISIKYMKLINESEIFRNKKHIMDSDSICIFEDEWINKKDIVKSRLRNYLGKSTRIYARKCEIRTPNNSEVREFLISNHTQGFVGSKVKLGLYYNNELVSLMTFGNLRKNLGQISKENHYELLRYCNKLNTTVIGGASKLFNFFIHKHNPTYILSYSDRRWGDGKLYNTLGFNQVRNNIIPNYFYIVNNKREGRFKYRKDILVKQGFDPKLTEIEIQHKRGLYRIFDAGSKKFGIYF